METFSNSEKSINSIREFLNGKDGIDIGSDNISVIGLFLTAQSNGIELPNGDFIAPHALSEFDGANYTSDEYQRSNPNVNPSVGDHGILDGQIIRITNPSGIPNWAGGNFVDVLLLSGARVFGRRNHYNDGLGVESGSLLAYPNTFSYWKMEALYGEYRDGVFYPQENNIGIMALGRWWFPGGANRVHFGAVGIDIDLKEQSFWGNTLSSDTSDILVWWGGDEAPLNNPSNMSLENKSLFSKPLSGPEQVEQLASSYSLEFLKTSPSLPVISASPPDEGFSPVNYNSRGWRKYGDYLYPLPYIYQDFPLPYFEEGGCYLANPSPIMPHYLIYKTTWNTGLVGSPLPDGTTYGVGPGVKTIDSYAAPRCGYYYIYVQLTLNVCSTSDVSKWSPNIKASIYKGGEEVYVIYEQVNNVVIKGFDTGSYATGAQVTPCPRAFSRSLLTDPDNYLSPPAPFILEKGDTLSLRIALSGNTSGQDQVGKMVGLLMYRGLHNSET